MNPSFSSKEISDILFKYWNIKVTTTYPCDSYQDQNTIIKTETGFKYVLKIANLNEKKPPLIFQNKMMKLLSNLLDLHCPKLFPSVDSEDIVTHQNHFIRLIEFIDGMLYINLKESGDIERYYK